MRAGDDAAMTRKVPATIRDHNVDVVIGTISAIDPGPTKFGSTVLVTLKVDDIFRGDTSTLCETHHRTLANIQ